MWGTKKKKKRQDWSNQLKDTDRHQKPERQVESLLKPLKGHGVLSSFMFNTWPARAVKEPDFRCFWWSYGITCYSITWETCTAERHNPPLPTHIHCHCHFPVLFFITTLITSPNTIYMTQLFCSFSLKFKCNHVTVSIFNKELLWLNNNKAKHTKRHTIFPSNKSKMHLLYLGCCDFKVRYCLVHFSP